MHTYTVSFFGHKRTGRSVEIEQILERVIRKLLASKEHLEFLVGRDGGFDLLVASTVRRCKRTVRDDNSVLILVLPYVTAEYTNNEESFHRYYDEIEICNASCDKFYKVAHQYRNRDMVNRSDLVVFCVEHNNGGAYETMKYADARGVDYINLLGEGNIEG